MLYKGIDILQYKVKSMLKREDIRIRDPYIVVHNDSYYMYATSGETTLSCYISRDLEIWEPIGTVFEIPKNFWAYKDVWAAEVHKYKDKFYLFVSLLGNNGLRGTQIAVCDVPTGPFVPLVDRPVTPIDQSCIDGTLYVHENTPYILYSHDWPDNYVDEADAYVGEICAAELSNDLTQIVGKPWVLFGSNESPYSKGKCIDAFWEGKNIRRYGSDAPFVQKLSDGRLLLTWSPYFEGNYVVLKVISESGDIKGPWTHILPPLYDNNGGHAMFFDDLSGRRCMCLHAPEKSMLERAHIFEVAEKDNNFIVLKEIYT